MVRLYEAGVFVSRILSHPHAKGCKSGTDLGADDLKTLAEAFKALVEKHLGKPFPDDPLAQMWGGIAAVFKSWNGKKAVSYRRIEGIPDDWGTAVNVQAMVFGNMGDSSATGVAFTRDPAIGDNKFYGEWLVNAQGEDVVAGIRTPSPINDDTKNEQNRHLVSMQQAMPGWPLLWRGLPPWMTTASGPSLQSWKADRASTTGAFPIFLRPIFSPGIWMPGPANLPRPCAVRSAPWPTSSRRPPCWSLTGPETCSKNCTNCWCPRCYGTVWVNTIRRTGWRVIS